MTHVTIAVRSSGNRFVMLLLGAVLGALAFQLVGGTAAPAVVVQSDLGLSAGTTEPASEPGEGVVPTTLRIASLNVLGHSHTAKGGNKLGWAPSQKRMQWQVQTLRAEGVDVVGFQELESPQYAKFTEMTAGQFGIWPSVNGRNKAVRNSIAYRISAWTFVSASTIQVPYFHGKPLDMPIVLLQSVATGEQVYVINFHNPADARGPHATWRAKGRAIQVAKVNELRATGIPVIWTGDFNDKEKAFCDVTGGTDLVAATGGSNLDGVCTPPDKMVIDWIFAPTGTTFTEVSYDSRPKIKKSTDHRLHLATATLPNGEEPPVECPPGNGNA